MVADRVYGRDFFEGSNGRTSLLHFAAAVPTIGFVHGVADLNPGNRAGFEGYTEARLTSARSQSTEPLVWSAQPSRRGL